MPINCYAYECDQKIDSISEEYNIPIFCQDFSDIKNKDIITFNRAEHDLIKKVDTPLYTFFHSFNKLMLNKYLKKIYLVKDLKLRNTDVGGLSDGSIIYVCLDNFNSLETAVYLNVLHHEFSSAIFRRLDPEKKFLWRSITGKYISNKEFFKKCLEDISFAKSSTMQDLENGILRNYSLTNAENDFNVFAETLFVDPDKIKTLSIKYQKIKDKLNLVKQSYIDAGYMKKFPDDT